MPLEIKHTTVAGGVNDATKNMSRDAWNAPLAATMATARILGRGTAGAGPVEELALGSNLSITAGVLNSSAASGVADGDKGDITVTGAGATWTIDPRAVTFGKIQNISTARLLGRVTAASGPIEEIVLGTNLSFSGNVLNAAGGTSSGSSLAIKDETTALGTPTTLTFTGLGVTASAGATGEVVVNVPGGGGGTAPALLNVFRVDDYCTTNTQAGNSAGLRALGQAVTAAGGGIIEFTANKNYDCGGQTFGPNNRDPAKFQNYTGIPDLLLEIFNCTKPVIIRGNGAKLNVIAGKYGIFDENGVKMNTVAPYGYPPYAVGGNSTYYVNVVYLKGCSGFIRIENLEVDGNMENAILGGEYGDTGWQLGGVGISLRENTGGYSLHNVVSYRHTSDSIHIDGVALTEGARSDRGHITNCKFNESGRLGMGMVGGVGWLIENTEFVGNANVPGSPLISNPAAGVDHEAEGGKINRDITYKNCSFTNNRNTQAVADSGPSERITFEDCKFVATVPGGATVWPNKPYIKFNRCLLAGTVIQEYHDPGNPARSPVWDDCTFTSDQAHGPAGVVEAANGNLVNTANNRHSHFNRCRFDFAKAGGGSVGNSEPDGPTFTDCTIVARNGATPTGALGRFRGKTTFVNEQSTPAGSIQLLPFNNFGPTDPNRFKAFGGAKTENGFAVHDVGQRDFSNLTIQPTVTVTNYPASFDSQARKNLYWGEADFDPPILAAGAKTAIQTMTVNGVAVGDRVDSVSFSQNLAGAEVKAFVSAANTVSYYFVNDNGVANLDLANGTVRVKIVGA